MPQISQVPGPFLTISGCMGLIHLPRSDALSTLPDADTRTFTSARTSISGLSRPSGLATVTRTLAVRSMGSTTGSISDTVPVNVSPGSASTPNSTFCPSRSQARSDS